jgi:retron-type reverse transcriptase
MNVKKTYIKRLEKALNERKKCNNEIIACINYAKMLLSNDLPVIFDFEHLSSLLGIDKAELSGIIYSNEMGMYNNIKIPKKSKGYRMISIPTINIKYIQKWLLKKVLNNIKVSKYAYGFEENKSIVSNATVHLKQECIINMYLKDFFPSIDIERIFMIFYYYGYTKEISYILSKICTYGGTLPQGASTSPKLSNICCIKLDKRLSQLC